MIVLNGVAIALCCYFIFVMFIIIICDCKKTLEIIGNIIGCFLNYFSHFIENYFYLIKPIFLGFICYTTTLLALKPILAKNYVLWAIIIFFLFFFSLIANIDFANINRIKLNRKKFNRKERFLLMIILAIVGLISFLITISSFNEVDSNSKNVIIIINCLKQFNY